MKEKLANHHTVVRQIMFEGVDVLIALLPDMLGNQWVGQLLRLQEGGVDSNNQNFFVVGTIEDADLAALWGASVRPPQIIVIELFGAWSLEGMNIATLRIHTGHDVFDHAVFASGIHPLNDEQQRPAILRVELLLQVTEKTNTVVDNFLALLLVLDLAGVACVVVF